MLTQEEFRNKFDRLVNALYNIQWRIGELEEFERQWQDLFDVLSDRVGAECKINILNYDVYQTFRWDKYQVLVSDLLSALENEIQNEHSTCHQSIHHLRIHDEEFYLNPERPINFIYDPGFPVSAEDQNRRKQDILKSNAATLRKHCLEAAKRLFPSLGDNGIPEKANLIELKTQLEKFRSEIYSFRQILAHKYQERIVERHSVSLEQANLAQIRRVETGFFRIVQGIGLINHHASYGKFESSSHKKSIQDQIDLILFGSINSMHARFYEKTERKEFYWQARDNFFKSEALLSIVAK